SKLGATCSAPAKSDSARCRHKLAAVAPTTTRLSAKDASSATTSQRGAGDLGKLVTAAGKGRPPRTDRLAQGYNRRGPPPSDPPAEAMRSAANRKGRAECHRRARPQGIHRRSPCRAQSQSSDGQPLATRTSERRKPRPTVAGQC